MAKRTLIHRGFLYAQQNSSPRPLFGGGPTTENISASRMKLAEAWRAGYLACSNDRRRRAKKK